MGDKEMMNHPDLKLTRIGIFADGGFFAEVSDYYRYHHFQKKRLSIEGIRSFVRQEAAKQEQVDMKFCRVVDFHYFRGRFSATEAQKRDKLFAERQFEDVLMKAGVVTHYFPRGGGAEKGIDVWLALEAFELAIYKQFNVLVLIAGDSDYVPLVRKLNTQGARVMLLAWDFSYQTDSGETRETRTSQTLIDEVTYPILMHNLIEDRSRGKDISMLFVPS